MRITLVVLHFFIPFFLFAQSRTIRGPVSDDKGAPLAGVSVLVKGTNNGAQTDAAGNFKLTVAGASGKVILTITYGSTARGLQSVTAPSVGTNTYKTSDAIFAFNPFSGVIDYPGTSTDLFTDPNAGTCWLKILRSPEDQPAATPDGGINN